MDCRKWLAALVAVLLVGFVASCGDNDDDNDPVGPTEPEYVGSATCINCHMSTDADLVEAYQESGHPYKLNKVVNGTPPVYPFTDPFDTPTNYSWDSVTYVIGGYGWKARFIDENGWIVTGDGVQWNLADEEWVGYSTGDAPGTKPYDCGSCHTTGWQTTSENGGRRQDNLPGMAGTFAETGITCESCHGKGSEHASSQEAADITIDRSAALCGQCHTRDSMNRIQAKGGFVEHHEQYDEFLVTGHYGMGQTCITCHDAHAGTLLDDQAAGTGLIKTCQSCHGNKATKHNAAADCVDCHMAKTGKSAASVNVHQGDVRSHVWNITTEAVTKDSMFYSEDGKTFAKDFITLDFACYGCHNDPNGIGGGGSEMDLDSLSSYAEGMHATTKVAVSLP